jgi:drug/metabolite transporter (DMT)-like permease
MSKNNNGLSGAMAIYYGIGAFLAGLSVLGALGVWFYQILTNQKEFSWLTVIGLLFIAIISLGIGYMLYRTGKEQMNN